MIYGVSSLQICALKLIEEVYSFLALGFFQYLKSPVKTDRGTSSDRQNPGGAVALSRVLPVRSLRDYRPTVESLNWAALATPSSHHFQAAMESSAACKISRSCSADFTFCTNAS